MTKDRRESFRLTDEASELLKQEAQSRGISKTAVIEQAIRDYARVSVTRRKKEER